MTETRFLHHILNLCRPTHRFPKEITHENYFHCCSLCTGPYVYGLWVERVPSLYSSAATGESAGNPVSCRCQRIALCCILFRLAGSWRTAAALRLLRATCADGVGGGALQHPCISPDDGTGQHRARSGRLRVVDSGLSSVPRKFQRHL